MPDEIQGGSTPAPDTNGTTPAKDAPPDVAAMVNQAVTNHLKRFAEKQLPGLFESALKPIHEKLSAAPAITPPVADTKKSPEYAALEQKLAEFEKRSQADSARAAAAEKKQREDRAFSDLRTQLTGKVLPDFLDVVSSHLFQVQKVVEFEEDGTPIFATMRKSPYGDEELRLPIKDGVEAWLKSDAARPYLPAPGTSGASPKPKGAPASFNPQFDPSKATDEEKIMHAMAVTQAIESQRR